MFVRYRNGDSAAVGPLFLALQKVIQGFYWGRFRHEEDIRELTQVALLKIHLARDSFDSSRSLKTWIFTIAGRCLIDHWRGAAHESAAQTENAVSPHGTQDGAHDPDRQASDIPDNGLPLERRIELNHDLKKAMESLKPIDRTIVYLYAVEGLSMAEIAEVVALSEGAVKLRAHRSYQLLRTQLQWAGLVLFVNAMCLMRELN